MLTQRQKDLLDFIAAYQKEHGGVSPSYAEMTIGIGLSAKSKGRIFDMLRSLEERGVIRRMKHHQRVIEIIPKERFAAFKFDPEDKILKPLETQLEIEDAIAGVGK